MKCRINDKTTATLEKNIKEQDATIPCLNGIRGIAALWVMVSHINLLSGMYRIPIISSGGLAVDLFMIMSGYLMVFHFEKRGEVEPWERPKT